MSRRAILLVDLDEEIAACVRYSAAQRALSVIDVHNEVSCPARAVELVLAVIQARPGDQAAVERARSLRKAFGDLRLLVLDAGLSSGERRALEDLGAYRFLSTSCDPDDLAVRCVELVVPAEPLPELVGDSPAMQTVRAQVRAAAVAPSNILLTGETGCGKGVVARALHRLSPRRERPFIHVDCSALSPTVIESELFGHERGAFTTAVARKPGRFELVADGTIFLDEVSELDHPLQAKFLRVLEDREFELVGGTTTQRLRGRVVAATNRKLDAEVSAGRFRTDLYYRLRVLHLEIPPLRDHVSDIPALAEACVRRLARDYGWPEPRIEPGFNERLMQHSWPGNVRELMNVIESAIVQGGALQLSASCLDGSSIQKRACDFEEASRGAATELPPDEQGERIVLSKLLRESGGNVARVARRCGKPRSTIRYRIQRYRLTDLIPTD